MKNFKPMGKLKNKKGIKKIVRICYDDVIATLKERLIHHKRELHEAHLKGEYEKATFHSLRAREFKSAIGVLAERQRAQY